MSSREQEARKILAEHDLLFAFEMLEDDDARESLMRIALGSKPGFDPRVHRGNDTLH